MKRSTIVASVAAFGTLLICLLVVWLGGYDFCRRSTEVGMGAAGIIYVTGAVFMLVKLFPHE